MLAILSGRTNQSRQNAGKRKKRCKLAKIRALPVEETAEIENRYHNAFFEYLKGVPVARNANFKKFTKTKNDGGPRVIVYWFVEISD